MWVDKSDPEWFLTDYFRNIDVFWRLFNRLYLKQLGKSRKPSWWATTVFQFFSKIIPSFIEIFYTLRCFRIFNISNFSFCYKAINICYRCFKMCLNVGEECKHEVGKIDIYREEVWGIHAFNCCKRFVLGDIQLMTWGISIRTKTLSILSHILT